MLDLSSMLPPPTDPTKPDPNKLRIQANVAKIRAGGGTEDDVDSYLADEEHQENTALSLGNIGRQALYGSTFGLAGSVPGMEARNSAQADFAKTHPNIDAAIKAISGTAAPLAIASAVPALGTAVSGVGLAGIIGYLSGAARSQQQGGGLTDQMKAGATEAVPNALLAGIIHGAVRTPEMFRTTPSRVIAGRASQLLEPTASADMNNVEALVPGGGSVVTNTVRDAGHTVSRYLPTLAKIGASPASAADAENTLNAQRAALNAKATDIGTQLDKFQGNLAVKKADYSLVRDVLAGKTPALVNGKMDLQDALGALSRIRQYARTVSERGPDVSGKGGGMTLHDLNQARQALQGAIYKANPGIEPLHTQYSMVMDQLDHANQALQVVQDSRASYGAGNGAEGVTLPGQAAHAVIHPKGAIASAVGKMFQRPAAQADAINQLLVQPGGAERVAAIRQAMMTPKPGITRFTNPIVAGAAPAAFNFLNQNQQP